MRTHKRAMAIAATILSVGALAACGSSDADETADTSAPQEMASSSPEDGMASGPVGPGCADYAEAVPSGSVEGMADDPVATAAGNSPILKTLTAAVSGGLNPEVNLVETLNGGEVTVFAPVDDAFAALPAATVKKLSRPANADQLSEILTYHVVPGQLTPDQVTGTQTTVQGGEIEVTGSGDMMMVNDAGVICGGVQTANATVYLVDAVLLP